MSNEYEIVIGLEVHAQLLTKSKLFCGDSIEFGSAPNTHVSPVTLAHPGTLPKMNKKAIELAIRAGLAFNCDIETENYFVRKNYFYPDLPKGYQVSQHTTPICKNGFIRFFVNENEKGIQLNRIHLEEDAGSSLHDLDEQYTSIDFNRAGTPLIEIVTEPCIASADEAHAFLTELRKLLRYLDVCDGNMEEGSLRCDANISAREKGNAQLGVKVEVKNLNSIRNVKKAIEYEAHRIIEKLKNKELIQQETRSYDADTDQTFSIRQKEDAEDYRYFPEPDLSPFVLQKEFIENIKKSIPVLPGERISKYVSVFGLSEYDARLLAEERNFADYFEEVTSYCANYKAVANWMLGPVKSWLNTNNTEIKDFPVAPAKLAGLIELIDSGQVSFTAASVKIFPWLLQNPLLSPKEFAVEENLIQQSDVTFLEPVIDEVLLGYADKVSEYRKGKKGLLALFVGEVMKRSKGKADPKITNELILQKLNNKTPNE
jgi:aspartyl-tRNA(Asn)/glutamyl-tRNA(Gln) amidotransferase subunit B